jgi:hypothetical protein
VTHPIVPDHSPSFISRSIEAIGAAVLTATLLVAVGLSSAEFARVSADAAPESVAAAFAGYRG